MGNKGNDPTDLPPLFIRERMTGRAKITGAELAERMGTTPATISRLLNGQRKMTIEWLYAFSKALNVPIASLFTPPTKDEPLSPEAQLRTALLAYGVNPDELGKAISAVKIFVEEHDEQSSEAPLSGLSGPSSRHREPTP